MSADQQTLHGELLDDADLCDLSRQGRILWEVGADDDFTDTRDELAEAHRRWVEAGLSDGGEA
jgi:hypothetical protein